MDIIVLLAFGFLLLGAILIFRKSHSREVDHFMQSRHGVQPLFKERSTQIKYHTLHDLLQVHADALAQLEQLKHDYDEHVINVDEYEASLDIMMKDHHAQ
ncbi:hypothetical protein C8P68_106125 [Mucilaginibacter yixingensis]|uniref:Uncharacterized protein n=1 Tax=Mucilaginibacter yixingensis TaxID=1295612 RepID=A0A2T5J762_9SPHI|nr:hypothetical protein [Mucilaginibacter yixingensis]PTQ94911.1 hypothetical protein C8P68_106125 [Mucilaginibacter yixingensis]